MNCKLCDICNRPLFFNILNLCKRLWSIIKGPLRSICIGSVIGASVLPSLGFRFAGVMTRSLAAAWQTPYTAAGSLFAILQSWGATGKGLLYFGVTGGIVSGLRNVILSSPYFTTIDWCYGHKD